MALGFEFLDFHEIATFLATSNHEKEEASFRTAIGRIYYTIYLIMRDKAKATRSYNYEEDYSGAGGFHRQLIAFFESPPKELVEDEEFMRKHGKTFYIIVRHLKDLLQLRVRADYKKAEVTKKDFESAKGLFKNLRVKIQNDDIWGF